MDAPSMVQRTGDTLIVRSVVSGDQIYLNESNQSTGTGTGGTQTTTSIPNASSTSTSATGTLCGRQQQFQQQQQQHQLHQQTLNDFEVLQNGCLNLKHSTDKYNTLAYDNNCNELNDADDDSAEDNDNGATGIDDALPQCKIKRNYSCNNCTYFTQNPRHFLMHLRDIHGEKIVINECKHCLYASRHYQKLVRHMKMVHGSTEGLEEQAQSRKRATQLARELRKRKATSDEQHQQQPQQTVQMLQTNQQNMIGSQLSRKLHEYPSQLNPGVGSSPSSSSSLLLAGGTLLPVNNNPNSGDSPIPGDGAGSSSSSTGSVSGGGLLGIASLHPSSPLNSPGTGGNMTGLGSGGNKLLKCTLCDYTALYRQQLLDHEREEHIKTKFFRCEKCSYVTHIKARFSKHVKYHSMPMIKCVKCDFRTPYKWNLDRHMKNHGGTGTFKCSACDFTADIKQSLTVHEMNHHIPPVGNAGNTGIARRRNKVGGTDLPDDYPSNYYGMESNDGSYSEFPLNNNTIDDLDSVGGVSGLAGSIKVKSEPDLIYQTEPADLSQKPYGNCNSPPQKKAKRPVPKLIPIQPTSTQVSPQFNEKSLMEKFTNFMNFGQFCAQMNTSSLKDLASCFISEEEVIQSSGGIDKRADTPQLSPSSTASSSTRRKNANIFNELKNKLGTGQTGNLQCNCGHVSKCLSESIIHQKACRKSIDENHHFTHSPVNLKINTGSTRCQYCRHRCKSSADLVAHMQNCLEARSVCDSLDSNSDIGSNNKVEMCEDVTDEAAVDDPNEDPHPMENVVFVWNKIPETSKSLLKTNSVPTTINNNTISNSINDHVPLNDLIVEMKEQGNVLHQKDILSSPTTSSTSQENSYYGVETAPGYGEVTKKMGPEDEDIHSSLKKVFKCPHCSFWASTASRFHVHIVGHLNKKPFECSLCSYRSNWRWDITKHIRLKTIRDPSHKTARVLMNDETGRRNYTKYNKFITLMKVTEEDGDPKLMKSGEMTPSQVASLSFIGSSGNNSIDLTGSPGSNTTKKLNDSSENLLSTVDMHGKFDPSALRIPIFSNEMLANNSPFKPFGLGLNMQSALAAADKNELLNATQIETEDKKPMCFKCKKCNFKNADKEVVLAHVKGHYDDAGLKLDDNKFPIPSMLPYTTLKPTGGVPPIHLNNNSIDMNNLLSAVCMLANNTGGDPKFREQFNAAFGNGGNQLANNGNQKTTSNEYGEMDEASSGVTSAPGWRGPQPYRCGHCQQVSNWKHVIQRHCRLKHNGDIRIEYIEKGSKTNVYKPLVMPNPNPGGANTSSSSSAATTGATGGGICTAAAVNQSSLANLMASGPSNAFNSQLNSDITKNELNLSNTFPSLTNWPCNLCPFTCTTPQELMNHVQHHVPQAGYDFKCTVCSYNSQTMDDLSQHMMLHKNQTIITSTEIEHPQQNRGKRYRCESCPYETDGKSQFNYHSSFHRTRKEALFKCDYCNYSVMKKHLLRQHTRMHLNSEVNSVTSDMASESAEDFDGHSDIMDLRIGGTEIGPSTELYFCSFCPARFASHRDIQLHLKMHFKSYSYKCQYCSYSTTTNLNLNHHDLVHSNLYNLETKKLAGIKINVDYQMPRYDMVTGADDTQMECWIVHLEDVIRITNQSLNIDREILENPNEIELFTDNNNQQIRNTQELRERQLNAQRQLNKTNFIKPIGSGEGDTNDRCQHCPYRSDSIEDLKNHMQYHFCVSGIERQVNCNHCDFSAESEYMFKDHIRVHFQFYDQVAFKTKYHNLELYAINENRLSSAGNGGGHNNGQQQTMSTSGGDMSDSDRLSIDSMSSPREQGGHSTLYSDEYDVDVNMHLIDKENKILVDMMKGGDLSK